LSGCEPIAIECCSDDVIKRAHLKHILGVLFQTQWKIDASLTFKNPVKW
jgi:hypothetical protein